ncbi:hypothetical protein [Microbacterium lacticum]
MRRKPSPASKDTGTPRPPHHRRSRAPSFSALQLPTRALIALWDDLAGWTEKYDPAQVAADLTASEWERIEAVVAETTGFFTRVRDARAAVPRQSVDALAG